MNKLKILNKQYYIDLFYTNVESTFYRIKITLLRILFTFAKTKVYWHFWIKIFYFLNLRQHVYLLSLAMKLSLEYFHKQWNLTFKRGLEWKAWVPAPNTDILEAKITLQLTQNSLATRRILIYNKLVQVQILFF